MLFLKIDHSNPRLIFTGKLNILEELDFSKTKNEVVIRNLNYFERLEQVFVLSALDENGVT